MVVEIVESKLRLHINTGYDVTTLLLPLTTDTNGFFNQQVSKELINFVVCLFF